MASIPKNNVPLPLDSCDKPSDPSLPIHVVTRSSQLPQEFIRPSRENPMVIGFDCEGPDLCRQGKLCIMQLAFPNAIYLVDAIEGGETLVKACKAALESSYITKVVHDCKRDSEALYFQFGIKLHNVVDTQIAYSLIKEQEGKKRSDGISFVALLADSDYGGISNNEKQEVRGILRRDPNLWTYRPLADLMIRTAADDVRFLLHVYAKMEEKLNQRSLWRLAVRGALHCRCFCINGNNFWDWPALPPVSETLIADKQTLEEETLSVLDVPPGKMGLIIGRRGANILSIKEGCSAEIIVGSESNKVFIIGAVKQVRKAEALIRGSLMHHSRDGCAVYKHTP